MRLTDKEFQETLRRVESRNRGWVRAEHNLGPIRVLLDGKELDMVMAVNRKKGKAIVAHKPIRLSRLRKKLMAYMAYGEITLERIDETN